MMNLDRKKLMIIAIVLSLILAAIMIYTIMNTTNVLDKEQEKQTNIYEVENNNSFVVKYGDYIYYVPENKTAYNIQNAYYICKIREDEIDSKEIGSNAVTMQSMTISPRIKIFANKMFVTQNKNTYKIEMGSGAKTFCDGEIQYIGENRAITCIDGNLYSVPYYEDTFMPQKYQEIVTGNSKYVSEDEKALYFYSTDSVGKQTAFSIDKENFVVTILLKLKSDDEKVEQIISTDKYVYCLTVKNNAKYLKQINRSNNEMNEKDLSEYGDVFIFSNDNKNNIYFYSSDKQIYICDDKTLSVEKFDGEVNGEYLPRYVTEFSGDEIKLYRDTKLLTNFNVDVNDLAKVQITDVAKINNFIYFKVFYSNQEEVVEVTHNIHAYDDVEIGEAEELIQKTIIIRVSTDGKVTQILK